MTNKLKTSLLLMTITGLQILFINADFVPSEQRTGRLLVLQEDGFGKHPDRIRHVLETLEGSVELKFSGQMQDLVTGMKLRVRGNRNGNVLAVDAAGVENISGGAANELPSASIGERKVLVLLVNFQDNPIQPKTVAEISNLVFSQANNFYKENSQQQMWLGGDVFGWYTLPLSQASCDTALIENAATQAVASAGISISGYQHIVYMFPNTTACTWGGLGTLGGSPGRIFLNGSFVGSDGYALIHELGHNLGLAHSGGLECGVSSVGSNCAKIEYGDPFDVMGTTHNGHFNAFQKEKLGWLNSLGFPPITTVQSSGSFTLSAYEAADSSAKALKILKSTDPVTGVRTWYYVEYRTLLGSDSYISALTNTNVPNGVVVHIGKDVAGISNPSLLDMTPVSFSSSTYDWNDSALPIGRTFTDPEAGLTLTTTAVNGSTATVTITMGPPLTNCGRASPILTASPQIQSGSAGTSLSYTVTVKNMDQAACGSSNFVFQVAHTLAWDENFAAGSVAVAPGAIASTTLTLRSPSYATGSNVVAFTATNSSAPTSFASANVSYQVVSGPQVSVATNLSSYSAGQTVGLQAIVMSGSAPVSGVKVSFSIRQPNGSVTTLSATTSPSGVALANYKLGRKPVKGNYTVTATATVGGLSGSGMTQFSVP